MLSEPLALPTPTTQPTQPKSSRVRRLAPLVVGALGVVAAVCLAVALLAPSNKSNESQEAVDRQWIAFKARYGHQFEGQADETRRAIFAENLQAINSHNEEHEQGKHGFTMAINEFAHLTPAEFASSRLSHYRRPAALDVDMSTFDHVTAQGSVDWVAAGAVTSVKDQHECGSCYSFATTGAIEGATAIATGMLRDLSQQNIVDCSYQYGNQGCDGGSLASAMQFALERGVCSAQEYPYVNSDRYACRPCTPVAYISGHKQVAQSEAALEAAVSQQPVAVALNAEGRDFQFYEQGVLTTTCEPTLNHGVLVVGYGTYVDGTPYWKIKNSWGTTWGQGGYMYLQRRKPVQGGQCGLLIDAHVPEVRIRQ